MDGCSKLGALLLVFVASCDVTHSCAHVYCDSGANLEAGTFSESDFARLTGARVDVCFNGTCSEGTIDGLPPLDGVHAISLDAPMDPVVSVSLQRFDPDTAIKVFVDVESSQLDLFQDGDVYTIDVVGSDGGQLVHKSWSVAYRDFPAQR